MVWELYGGSIGDTLNQGIPFGRLSVVRGSPRRCAHAAMAGDVMSTNQGGTKPERNRGRQHLPAGLSQVNLNAAGIDVGATSHYVAVPADRAEPPVREYEAFTADLYRLADWLAECGVETVVMESTGVYWIPLFGVLEERDFQVMLVDPRRIKNGRAARPTCWTASGYSSCTLTACSPEPSGLTEKSGACGVI